MGTGSGELELRCEYANCFPRNFVDQWLYLLRIHCQKLGASQFRFVKAMQLAARIARPNRRAQRAGGDEDYPTVLERCRDALNKSKVHALYR